jgi:hypothetical protein
MQTSAAVVFRALVMLACLIIIPLVALFGSSLPKVVSSVLEGRWPAGTGKEPGPAAAKGPGIEAAQFEPSPTPGGIPVGPAEPIVPKWQSDPLRDSLKWPAGPFDAPSSPITPAGYDSPLVELPSAPRRPAVGAFGTEIHQTAVTTRQGGPAADDLHRLRMSDQGSDSGMPTAYSDGGTTPSGASAMQTLSSADQFKHIHERLRALGATYYLLESWGNRHDYYRFYCQMAIGGNASYSRPFQATHSDPIEAMTQVLRQVESWRASRQ